MLYRDVYGSRGPGRSNPTYRVGSQHDRLDSPGQTPSKNSGIVSFFLFSWARVSNLLRTRSIIWLSPENANLPRVFVFTDLLYLLSLANLGQYLRYSLRAIRSLTFPAKSFSVGKKKDTFSPLLHWKSSVDSPGIIYTGTGSGPRSKWSGKCCIFLVWKDDFSMISWTKVSWYASRRAS